MPITVQVINDGPRNLVVNIHITGTTDVTDTVLIDASTYSPAFTKLRLMRSHATLVGFTAHLLWDATANVEFISIPDYDSDADCTPFGGIPNNAGAGRTGDVLITTVGLGAADHGSIILEFVKADHVD